MKLQVGGVEDSTACPDRGGKEKVFPNVDFYS